MNLMIPTLSNVNLYVGASNDYQKDLQFKKLNAQKDAIDVKVLRNGQEALIPNTELLVGDVLLLDTGDKIAADGIAFISYGLVADEASLTGESEPQHKGQDELWCLSGTQVCHLYYHTFCTLRHQICLLSFCQ